MRGCGKKTGRFLSRAGEDMEGEDLRRAKAFFEE
jgi:hypothetical protein